MVSGIKESTRYRKGNKIIEEQQNRKLDTSGLPPENREMECRRNREGRIWN